MQTNRFRNIEPNDYVMTNTGYDYPEYVDDESEKKFNGVFQNNLSR